MALYYSDESLKEWFIQEYKATGKRLDIGKSCVRFKKLENLPLDLIGKAVSKTSVEDYIQIYKKVKSIK